MSSESRKYELKARAEAQRETRERIAAVAAGLHEEKGVAKTTVAEIARRAGVTRLTVYNHFPALEDLIPACAAHYTARHPLPDFSAALELEDDRARVRAAVGDFYAWYREVEPMFGKLFSDRANVPELDRFMADHIDQTQADLAADLAKRFGARGRRAERLRALLRVAVDFWTWRRLAREGLDDEAAAELMAGSVAAAV